MLRDTSKALHAGVGRRTSKYRTIARRAPISTGRVPTV